MTCHNCKIEAQKFGKDRKGNQRYRCNQCRKTFQEYKERLLGNMILSEEKSLLVLRLLLEGNSIRSIERITGIEKKTITRVLLNAGERCDDLMAAKIKGVAVKDVEADEIWGFVGMKKITRLHKGVTDPQVGDAYTFVGMERNTKLVLAWHLGQRDGANTEAFTEKLDRATSGHFQLTTDGFGAYPDAVSYSLGTRVDYAQLIKVYGHDRDPEGEQKYSPPEVVDIITKTIIGTPEPHRVCTSIVERGNLSMRTSIRRLTRLTNAFSKKWDNLKAMLALYFAYYNFCRIHSSIRCTPAMESGITQHVWTLRDLLTA
jgi:transposase-like protein/IS1 family transposase